MKLTPTERRVLTDLKNGNSVSVWPPSLAPLASTVDSLLRRGLIREVTKQHRNYVQLCGYLVTDQGEQALAGTEYSF